MKSSNNPFQRGLSLLLVSIGVMTTMTFGFVPLINFLNTYYMVILVFLFWTPFGITCLIFGHYIDKVQSKEKLLIAYPIWGILIIMLNFMTQNIIMAIIIIIAIAVLTSFNVIIGTSYMSSNIQITKRGFTAGIYLGIGWGLVALTAFISFINLHVNLIVLGIMNILVGVFSFFLIKYRNATLNWQQLVNVPRDFDVRKNGLIYWMSSLVFSTFLGIIVFLLGTRINFVYTDSIYLQNVIYYYEVAESFGLGLVNFDFIVVGLLNVVISPLFGKLTDKYGRKRIFLITNLFIPLVLIFFTLWQLFAFLVVSLILYSCVCASYVVMEAAVWSDLAPENGVARFNGYGWSSNGIGGSIGFIAGYLITLPEFSARIDILVIMTIIILSEISMIPFVSMKDSLPPAEEIEWFKEILHLYVIKEGGVFLTDYSFTEQDTFDVDLLAGGMTGVTTILKEMVDSEKKLKAVDHEDKKIMFEFGKGFFIVLIANKELRILREKLIKLKRQIDDVYWETMEIWAGDLDIFKPIKTMIKNIFIE